MCYIYKFYINNYIYACVNIYTYTQMYVYTYMYIYKSDNTHTHIYIRRFTDPAVLGIIRL